MKTWCKHIRKVTGTYSGTKWRIQMTQHALVPHVSNMTVPSSWKVCPICEVERPTQANIRAATNRAAQDGEQ